MRVLDVVADAGAGRQGSRARSRPRACSRSSCVELEAHDPGVRLGDDSEDVHRSRVATRRTRAVIRATTAAARRGAGAARGRAEVARRRARPGARPRRAARASAAARSPTLGATTRGGRGDRGRARGASATAASDALLAALDSERYLALLDDVRGGGRVPARARRARRRDAARGRRAATGCARPPTASATIRRTTSCTRLRIHAKRARYAAELDGRQEASTRISMRSSACRT